jgi:hypothetical protein
MKISLAFIVVFYASVLLAEVPTNEFCSRNMLLRFIQRQPHAPNDSARLSTPDLEKLADQLAQGTEDANDAYSASLIPTALSMRQVLNSLATTWNLNSFSQFRSVLLSSTPSNQIHRNRIIEYLSDVERSGSKGALPSYLERAYACFNVPSGARQDCQRGLEIFAKTRLPYATKGGDIWGIATWKEILGQEKYEAPLQAAAMRAMNRIGNDTSVSGNIFQDLKESFQSFRFSPEQATEASFMTMEIIVNGGAGLARRLMAITGADSKIGISLSLLSSLMPVLDFQSSRKNLPAYSYPSEISTSCSYSRPLVFWMGAVMARKLVRNYQMNGLGAYYSVFNAQKGIAFQRDNTNVFTKPAFDSVHQVIRMDLAFGSAGAQFGAGLIAASPSPKNVDRGLEYLLQSAVNLPSLSQRESADMNRMAKYSRWHKIFQPDGLVNIQ